jgi:hypothetical protein
MGLLREKRGPDIMIARLLSCVPTPMGLSLLMLTCVFEGMLIHGMKSNGHRKVGRPEISSQGNSL